MKIKTFFSNPIRPPSKSPGFLRWLKTKRMKKRKRRKILKKIIIKMNKRIEKEAFIKKKEAFMKIYMFDKVKQHEREIRWEKICKNYFEIIGDPPPFVIKRWFFED